MLTGQELAAMRAEATRIFDRLCTIQTVTRTSDNQGTFVEAWASTYTNVPCRLAPLTLKQTNTQGDQFRAVSGWVLSLAYNQTIAADDRVLLDGTTYDVQSVEDVHSERALRRIFLRRVE